MSPKKKPSPKSHASHAGSPSPLDTPGTPVKTDGVNEPNKEYLSIIENAVAGVMPCPVFNNIQSELPLDISTGGHQQPFCQKIFTLAMETWGKYGCDCNLFWMQVIFSSMPGIPTHMCHVQKLMDYYFKAPWGAEQTIHHCR